MIRRPSRPRAWVLGVSLVTALLAAACRADPAGDAARDPREAVVVLHGLGRDAGSMATLARRVAAGGFRVENHDYPSTQGSLDELVSGLSTSVASCCADAPRVHFVTYSLGGILVRAFLAEQRPPHLGRVVMIAPPNRGSEWVDRLGDTVAFERAYGAVGRALGTGPDSLPNRLGPADFEVGVIAGTAALNPMGAALIPGEDDGTVSVESAKLEGMSDFLTVPHSHTFIMNSRAVAAATLRFLETGRFSVDPSDASEGPRAGD